MRPLTFSANKHLIPVGNKPLIFYPIEAVIAAGIKDIAFTYNPGGLELIQRVLGDGSQWGAKFTYVLQEEPKGLANIFQVCEDFIDGESFCLHLGDNIFNGGIKNLVEHFNKEKPKGLVGIVHHPENTRLGVPYFDEKGRLIKYVEKPSNPPHDYAIPGIYFFDNMIFDCFKGKNQIVPSERGELEIAAAFQWLIDKNLRVDTLEIVGEWLDPGKVDDWLEANMFLLDRNTQTKIDSKIDDTVKIHGRVVIGKNCDVKNTIIKGPVNIGDNCILNDANIGPFTSIYHGCTVIGSTITNSVVMEGVVIDKIKKNIDDSIIGPNTNVSQNPRSENKCEILVGELSKITF